jgi:hypothetical protein
MACSDARSRAERRAVRRDLAVAAALYALVAIVITWPLVWRPTALLAAPFGEGDPYLNLWILGWDLRVLFDTPSAVFDGRVFEAPIFHPARQTLAFSDHLLLQALLVSPLYAATRDPVLAYNAVWLGSLWASGLAMWWYLREVTGARIGTLAGGLIYAFSAYRLSHVVHLQLQALYFLPLAALAVHRIVARRRARDGAALGLWFGLTTVSSVYYAVIGGLGLALLLVGLVAVAGRSRLGRLVKPLACAALVTAVLAVPVLVPYAQVQQREGFGRTLEEASRHAAAWHAYVSEPPWRPVALAPVGRTEEDGLRPGWGAIVLAAMALASLGRRGRRPHVWAWLAVAALGVVLSLGPDGARTVYAWCHRWLFGFHAVRAPARFGLLVTFAAAGLAAYGLQWARRRGGAWRIAALAALVVVVGEAMTWRMPAIAAPQIEHEVSRWLRDAEGPGAVAYVPMQPDRGATTAMLDTLVHGRPIVNGYSGQRPAFASAVEGALSTFPSSDALWMLSDLGVRFVVSPLPDVAAAWPMHLRASLQGTDGQPAFVYELADDATLERVLGPEPGVVPPEPSTPAFRDGERSTYDVFWDGAGTQIAAGTVVLAIDAARPDDPLLPAWVSAAQRGTLAWRVTATLETAPWVARFFEAKDTFTTWTTSRLLPVAHRRQLHEGRRRVDQSVAFDDEGRGVVVLPPDAASLDAGPRVRVPATVRDPMAAFLLLRAVPLSPGHEVQLPVSDMGRVLTLETGAPAADTLEWQGRRMDAVRLEPVLVPRVPRRAPPDIAVWLAPALEWRPIRAEVEAGFGRVRLELVATEAGGEREGT